MKVVLAALLLLIGVLLIAVGFLSEESLKKIKVKLQDLPGFLRTRPKVRFPGRFKIPFEVVFILRDLGTQLRIQRLGTKLARAKKNAGEVCRRAAAFVRKKRPPVDLRGKSCPHCGKGLVRENPYVCPHCKAFLPGYERAFLAGKSDSPIVEAENILFEMRIGMAVFVILMALPFFATGIWDNVAYFLVRFPQRIVFFRLSALEVLLILYFILVFIASAVLYFQSATRVFEKIGTALNSGQAFVGQHKRVIIYSLSILLLVVVALIFA